MLKEKKFTHVQASERDNIAIFKVQNKSDRFIAKELGRSPSTMTREFQRGITHNGHYFPNASQSIADKKKKNSNRKRKIDNPEVQKYIIEKIQMPFLWSPEIVKWKKLKFMGTFFPGIVGKF